MILGAFRRFTQSSLAARSLDPVQFNEAHHNLPSISRNPTDHTLGLIGLGRIGLRVAQKATVALGMKIAYYDIVRTDPEVEAFIAARFEPSLEQLLAKSDCIILAAPYTGEVLLGKSEFSAMKCGARFINIARGKMIDEEALITALESGKISAAALDVHFDEPNVNPILARMPNVELHCHTAGGSVDSHVGFERMGIENILYYFKMGTPISAVNLKDFSSKGYEIITKP
jgi:lactate dehydrogenase-like 2-hydroxyacid dehydrogenase